MDLNLRAIRCRLAFPDQDRLAFDICTGPPGVLQGESRDSPAAYLVLAADLAPLRELKAAFIDRGRKHPAKPLSAFLLGQSRMPLTVGAYRSGGQLVRSVRTLLRNATKKRERNVYVIGLTDRLLREVAKRAATPSLEQAQRAVSSTPGSLVSLAGDEGAFPAGEYLNLLEPDEVPEKLKAKLVGDSREMQLVRELVVLASRHAEPVLILGDTGTGKEVAARAIHDLDAERRLHSFIPVNCGAIARDLFETELFGYAPGAFTGALRYGKPGLWVKADRGTLFLDEIGDLPLGHQAKILRVLEDGIVRPVGGLTEVKGRCRVIAATNRDLYGMVQSGAFREDLYYRLRPFLIRTPRLRVHPTDIPVLARFFWETVAPGRSSLSDAVLATLERYRWPGNARELRAVLTSMATMFPKVTPRVKHVRAVFQMQSATRIDDERLGPEDDARIHRVECLRHLRRVDEVIRACKVMLRSFASGRPEQTDEAGMRRVRTVISHRLAELRLLGTQPLLFHSIATFDVLNRAMGGLTTLQSLLERDANEARRFWKKELAGEVTAALSAIVREVERLLKKL